MARLDSKNFDIEVKLNSNTLELGRLTNEFLTNPDTVSAEIEEEINFTLEDVVRDAIIDRSEELTTLVAEVAEVTLNNAEKFALAIDKVKFIGMINRVTINGEGPFELHDTGADVDTAIHDMNIVEDAKVVLMTDVTMNLDDLLDAIKEVK